MPNNSTKAIPEGYVGVTPYLTVKNAAQAIEFYRNVFGAEERFRMAEPSGRIGHAEIMIGGAPVMLSDEYPEMDVKGPESYGGSPVTLHLYVENVDHVVEKAVSAGATVLRLVADQFYGDRGGKLRDPFGHIWWIGTHIEDVSPEEMKRRAEALFG